MSGGFNLFRFIHQYFYCKIVNPQGKSCQKNLFVVPEKIKAETEVKKEEGKEKEEEEGKEEEKKEEEEIVDPYYNLTKHYHNPKVLSEAETVVANPKVLSEAETVVADAVEKVHKAKGLQFLLDTERYEFQRLNAKLLVIEQKANRAENRDFINGIKEEITDIIRTKFIMNNKYFLISCVNFKPENIKWGIYLLSKIYNDSFNNLTERQQKFLIECKYVLLNKYNVKIVDIFKTMESKFNELEISPVILDEEYTELKKFQNIISLIIAELGKFFSDESSIPLFMKNIYEINTNIETYRNLLENEYKKILIASSSTIISILSEHFTNFNYNPKNINLEEAINYFNQKHFTENMETAQKLIETYYKKDDILLTKLQNIFFQKLDSYVIKYKELILFLYTEYRQQEQAPQEQARQEQARQEQARQTQNAKISQGDLKNLEEFLQLKYQTKNNPTENIQTKIKEVITNFKTFFEKVPTKRDYRKLISVFHPDKNLSQKEKACYFTKLINNRKDKFEDKD